MTRRLIVNADDLGFSDAVNAGIAVAHDDGIVTSASLMVRQPAAVAAVALARRRPALAVGLHVDLGEWVHTGDGWVARDVVVDTDDRDGVEVEVGRQLERFEALVGVAPTHLDGHQHVQRHEPAATVLRAVADRLRVPLRMSEPDIGYTGAFHGQGARGEPYPAGVTTAALVAVIATIEDGWTELGCHPGLGVDPATTTYALERDAEVAALCSAEVRAALSRHGVVLASFAEAPPRAHGRAT